MLEQAIISGIAHDTSEAKVTIRRVPDRPGVAGRTFRPLADAGINIDEIVQNTSRRRARRHLLHAPRERARRAPSRSSSSSRREIEAEGFTSERDIAKVSVVGAGMRSNPGVAAAIFEALADAGINIEIISTSSIRVSCVVPGERVRARRERDPRAAAARGRVLRRRSDVDRPADRPRSSLPGPDPLGHRLRLLAVDLAARPSNRFDGRVRALAAQLLELVPRAAESGPLTISYSIASASSAFCTRQQDGRRDLTQRFEQR